MRADRRGYWMALSHGADDDSVPTVAMRVSRGPRRKVISAKTRDGAALLTQWVTRSQPC